MRNIRITEEVWSEIAKRGRFGETEDDVLRRVFKITGRAGPSTSLEAGSKGVRRRGHFAKVRMHAGVHNDQLLVSFESGVRRQWDLPDRAEKERIRRIRSDAVEFAIQNGATEGQKYAVMKALTEAGFHLTK